MEKDGNQYYTYILFYIDDILIVDKDPRKFMSMLMDNYTFKTSIIVDPKLYLGTDIGRIAHGYGSYEWKTSLDHYVTEEIRNVKKLMIESNMEFKKIISYIHYSLKN